MLISLFCYLLALGAKEIAVIFPPLLVGYLWQLSKVGRLRGPNALVHLSSTQSLRGALVLSQPSNQS